MSANNNNETIEKPINDNVSAATAPKSASRKKSKKGAKKNAQAKAQAQKVNSNYEHHLEKWLENTSKANYEYGNLDGNWPFMSSPNAPFQQSTNRKGNGSLPQQYGDPISLPSHINAVDATPSISAFMNFNSPFKQQYPHLLQRQKSQSPISNDLTSMSTQQDFMSLPSNSKSDKLTPIDVERLNDIINQTKRFNDLLIDDTHKTMNASNNSTKPTESSIEDEIDDDDDVGDGGNNQNGANGTEINNQQLLVTLMKQINLLHETNSKIFRNLHETKVEMEALKYAPSWGLRHRRDSVSGMSVHSQPFGYGGLASHGMASPAPTYLSQGGSNYPGVVTDLVREVRDAGRVRDDSLINRVKAMIDEKSWTMNESNMRALRDLEEIKVHLHGLKVDRQSTSDRLSKLEDEVRSIKNLLSASNASPFQQYSQFPSNSNLAMNDQVKRSNMNISYGIINSTGEGFEDTFNQKRFAQQSPTKRHDTSNELDEELFDGAHVMQMEKDTLKLRRDLQDAIASKKQAESRILALEHLVTSLKSPSQTNLTYHPINNQANGANKPSLPSDFQQPQQHQLQIQINGGDQSRRRSAEQHVSTPLGNQTTGKLSSPKSAKATQVHLSSSAGPVTDL